MSRILVLDIETAPVIAKVWSLWKQNVSLDQIEDDWYIMSYAAKWLGKPDVFYKDCRDDIGNDFNILSDIHSLLNDADIVIAHNGDKFDIPKINARFILSGFSPPAPYKTIDTVKVAKKTFNFTSNKLEYLAKNLCEEQKLDHSKYAGFKLWNACMAGNTDAWDEMEKYNRMDVVSLEELYLILRPWITNHPSLAVYEANVQLQCPKCQSTKVYRRGFVYTNKNKYQRYSCQDCGGWSQETYSSTTKEKRKSILTSK